MKAEVTVDGVTTPVVEVNNGLRQGCTIAPSLFRGVEVPAFRKTCDVQVWWQVGGRTDKPTFKDDTFSLLIMAVVGATSESNERAAYVSEEVTSERG